MFKPKINCFTLLLLFFIVLCLLCTFLVECRYNMGLIYGGATQGLCSFFLPPLPLSLLSPIPPSPFPFVAFSGYPSETLHVCRQVILEIMDPGPYVSYRSVYGPPLAIEVEGWMYICRFAFLFCSLMPYSTSAVCLISLFIC